MVWLRRAKVVADPIPGAIYHLMHRSDRRERIFRDDPDRGLLAHGQRQLCESLSVEEMKLSIVVTPSLHGLERFQ